MNANGCLAILFKTSPCSKSRLRETFGVNNVFNVNPPGCFNCDLNNYGAKTYDVPGQFGYIRLSYHM